MKRYLLLLFFVQLPFMVISAQTESSASKSADQVIKERREVSKLSEEAVEKKSIGEAKKQAKALKKDGWKPAPGSASLDRQLTELLLRQYATQGNFPKYIIGKSSARAGSYGVARRQATARARLEIATALGAEVAALTEMTDANTELTAGEAATVAKVVDTSKQLVQQSIGKTDIVFEACREVNGNTEVQIGLSYDGNLAKQAILKLFDKDNAEIKDKLEKLLQSK